MKMKTKTKTTRGRAYRTGGAESKVRHAVFKVGRELCCRDDFATFCVDVWPRFCGCWVELVTWMANAHLLLFLVGDFLCSRVRTSMAQVKW